MTPDGTTIARLRNAKAYTQEKLAAFSREDRISRPKSGGERDSLISAEIPLIADLNSLQGRKKFPVRVRRELARKALV